MLKKSAYVFILVSVLCVIGVPVFAAEIFTPKPDPVNPEYLKWLERLEQKSSQNNPEESGQNQERNYGVTPSPIDRSHLWKDTPRPQVSAKVQAMSVPSYYSLNTQLPEIRDQGDFGTCWAFAAIGSMESTYIKKYWSWPELSEMHLAYFVYGDTRSGKSFALNDRYKHILDQAGDSDKATAFLSRAGTIYESTLPYPIRASSYVKPDKFPEEYESSGVRRELPPLIEVGAS